MKKFKTLVVDTTSSLVENINFVEAENCANRLSEFGTRLAIVLRKMNEIPEE